MPVVRLRLRPQIDGGGCVADSCHASATAQFRSYHPNRRAAPLCLSPACTTFASVFRPNWKIP